MSATIELFERWKASKGIESDRQALRTLGLSPGAAVHWKAGKEAGADVIERLARDLGESPAQWAARAMAGQTKGDTARAWARIAKQLGAAAVIALAALLPVSQADANPLNQQASSSAMHIMSTVMRWLRRAASYAGRLFPAAPSALLADT